MSEAFKLRAKDVATLQFLFFYFLSLSTYFYKIFLFTFVDVKIMVALEFNGKSSINISPHFLKLQHRENEIFWKSTVGWVM